MPYVSEISMFAAAFIASFVFGDTMVERIAASRHGAQVSRAARAVARRLRLL